MKAAVIGSGAWGTALAIRLLENGHDVTMWSFSRDSIPEMESTRCNPRLPSAVLPENLAISGEYDCVRGCKLVVMASPSFPARAVCRSVAERLNGDVTHLLDMLNPLGGDTCLDIPVSYTHLTLPTILLV